MKYGIVIFPSKALQDKANSFRKRYDPHYALIPPHITLKSTFEVNDVDIKDIADQLHQTAQRFAPFQIKVTKFSSFQPVNNVIYMKIIPEPEIVDLHEAVNAVIADSPSEYSFVPHITVGQDLSNDEHSDVYSSLRLQEINHEETIDRFHLLYQLDNGSWTVYETFRLRKE
ncbi:putative phosphoesterase YjcG [Robertmurraya siralis]|uniref:Putative phosphoesterase J27TS8_43760 n=1 Tax=Robertmurraya siralis TaxID=77777 RepID=A0A920BVX1_9BACI|nr:YjcG family protein [Robertmurraya siralis]PAE20699.1 hypothetical protein CHH80_10480 [Bacillus sp. 7504-2]GIN64383.1 putative phosphoesterase YjcG [Robertmurraya siralis]